MHTIRKGLPLVLFILLTATGSGLQLTQAPVWAMEKSVNAACSPHMAEFRQKQEALISTSEGMMQCAKAGDVNYDCSQDFAAIHKTYNDFQSTLNNKLRPCVDTPWLNKKAAPAKKK